MPCPLFLPAASLGDYYAGVCSAAASDPIAPDTLRKCCNVGYARRTCERAANTEADAIEFVVRADRGGEVELGWSMERNHHPLAVGVMILPPSPATPLEFQARAFGAAYLQQKI
jgi:hypothetical protein